MMAPLSAIKKLQENINDLNKIQSSESFDLDADGKPIAPGVMKDRTSRNMNFSYKYLTCHNNFVMINTLRLLLTE